MAAEVGKRFETELMVVLVRLIRCFRADSVEWISEGWVGAVEEVWWL